MNLQYVEDSFATPALVVKPDATASVKTSSPNGYSLSLTVLELDSDKVAVATKLQSSHGNIAPELVVYLGQSATASVGPLGLTVTVENGS